MADDEEIRSLSAANGRFNSQENETNAKGLKLRRMKYVTCCGFCTATVLIVVAIFLTLLFTLFLRDPEIKMNKLTVVKLKFFDGTTIPDPKFNVSLVADVSMKNPNAATFKYGNSTTVIYHRGNQIGEIPIPPGRAKPRRTQQMDLPFELDTARLYSTPDIQSDAVSGVMNMTSKTRVVAKMSKLKQVEEESTSGWSNLPEGISDEIFLRLPGNSILSSRCVCKHFHNLLSKPSFIKNHLNQTKHNNPKLLFRHTTRDYGPMIYSIGIDKLPSAGFDGSVLINYPFEPKNLYALHLLGSFNGLVCLKFCRIDDIGDQGRRCVVETEYFSILNPLTKEFKEFTRPEEIYGDVTYGFGYDSNTDDYKLVIISDYGGCFKIDIYTLRKDSWSCILGDVGFSFRCRKGYYGVSFNGCLHWLGRIDTQGTSSEVIFSFHISNEIVVNMPLPENIMPPTNYSGDVYKNLGVWGDCIGIACIWKSVKVDVWVMQEYGEKESWIKKYTITQLPSPPREIPFWRPLWCFDNGQILVDNDREQLHLYNPRTTEVRPMVVRGINTDNSRESYVESIVSVGSGTYLKKPITDGVVKNSERQRLR